MTAQLLESVKDGSRIVARRDAVYQVDDGERLRVVTQVHLGLQG
jgi:hypothetical protein